MASPTPQPLFQHSLVYTLDQIVPGTGPSDFSQPDPGLIFLKEIMQFDDAEIQQFSAGAETFFRDTYGFDFTRVEADKNNMKMIPGVQLMPFHFSPDAELTVIFHHRIEDLSHENRVRDGGYLAMVTGPGVSYGGTFGGPAGKPASMFEFVVTGFYNIVNLDPETGQPDDSCDPIVISYHALGPIRTTPDGDMVLHCGLTHPEWGGGAGRGIQTITPSDATHLRVMQRNVLTFPASPVP